MKQEQWTSSPPRAPRGLPGRSPRADVAMVAPKLTKLVTTKIITPRPPAKDARALERERLLDALLRAKGRSDVTRATEAFYGAGHSLDLRDQEPHLQMLEHADDERVRQALQALSTIFDGDAPRHRPLLEQRLARIEQLAEEPATREAATALRRKIGTGFQTTTTTLAQRASL